VTVESLVEIGLGQVDAEPAADDGP
jgi:hypothetical protein